MRGKGVYRLKKAVSNRLVYKNYELYFSKYLFLMKNTFIRANKRYFYFKKGIHQWFRMTICFVSGCSRGNLFYWKISRYFYKKFANEGYLSGVKKYYW